MRTRRGVERHPTGDSDVLGEMMYQSASLREPQRRRPTKKLNDDDEEEGTIKTQQESCDEEEVVASAVVVIEEETPKKKPGPIRTRRGVQRKSTGDSDQLGLMLYGVANPSRCTAASAASESNGVPTEISLSSSVPSSDTAVAPEPRRRGRRKASVTVDDSENVDDSTNDDGNWNFHGSVGSMWCDLHILFLWHWYYHEQH